ncbi:MAG: gamma-glutamyl-gamma-aminobutyrate hydrolase family protein [Candidatus Sumerlaeota bacterium]|nr:gamma-glutamyl-gamma-aminobutyrate hydrolase family protein [Candidatus Sumerlaeota bacterium]
MAHPVIALSAGRHRMDSEPYQIQDMLYGCPYEYAGAIERAGGAPMLIPPLENPEAAARIIEKSCDGLLLTGGPDVDPLLYGAEPHPKIGIVDPARDATEAALIRAALKRGMPLLAICRGIQILNVAVGGRAGGRAVGMDSPAGAALGLDSPAGMPALPVSLPVNHRQHSQYYFGSHTIEITAGSLLEHVMGPGPQRVNSYHHQAVDKLAPGLTVTALARDGIIESIESTQGARILAVQFHPERTASAEPPSQALFRWLVAEAGKS